MIRTMAYVTQRRTIKNMYRKKIVPKPNSIKLLHVPEINLSMSTKYYDIAHIQIHSTLESANPFH